MKKLPFTQHDCEAPDDAGRCGCGQAYGFAMAALYQIFDSDDPVFIEEMAENALIEIYGSVDKAFADFYQS